MRTRAAVSSTLVFAERGSLDRCHRCTSDDGHSLPSAADCLLVTCGTTRSVELAHIDFGSPVDASGGLWPSAPYQADDTFGQAEHRRLAKVLALMHRSSATASATVEAFGSDP